MLLFALYCCCIGANLSHAGIIKTFCSTLFIFHPIPSDPVVNQTGDFHRTGSRLFYHFISLQSPRITQLQSSDTESKKSRAHLDRHFDQHQQLLDANPQALASHCFGNAAPLTFLKTAQQLRCSGDKRRAT